MLKRLPAGGYHVRDRHIIEVIPFCTSMSEQEPFEYLDSFVGLKPLRYPALQLLAFNEDLVRRVSVF